MHDKTIVITGASDGIGKAAAYELTNLGAHVVIIGRSPEKTEIVARELDVDYFVTDFSKLAEVRELAHKLCDEYPRIDVLVNNAGGVFGKRELTIDGFEKTLQVNHLSHFLLTKLLMDTLIANKATIINTSSIANQVFAKFDIDDLNMEKHYTANSAYGNAKLENILFTKAIDKRYGAQGVAAVSFHPGNVATSFATESSGFLKLMYQSPLKRLAGLITPEEGAETLVWLASTTPRKDWTPGQYYVRKKLAKTNRLANDEHLADSLWQQSEQMTR